jgi:hypothetical protein
MKISMKRYIHTYKQKLPFVERESAHAHTPVVEKRILSRLDAKQRSIFYAVIKSAADQ